MESASSNGTPERRRVSIEWNRDLIQAQAHNHHNEPITHLEHSRGNQTTPTRSSDTLAGHDHRRRTALERCWIPRDSLRLHQSYNAGYKRRLHTVKKNTVYRRRYPLFGKGTTTTLYLSEREERESTILLLAP
ncbi:hypothetical protein DY000_02004841 [Brassica cretica]|uniref:Uncharacterized protein n=1 Tax=Brassica cretica TaxID=69181 RepID=A0ABQ7C0J7_BRACR|nr:hypothetical protein DY000_02004841 [Brassica cretica]